MLALLQDKAQQNFGLQLAQLRLRSFRFELRIEKQTDKERPLLAGAGLEPSDLEQMFLVVIDQKVER